MKNKTLTAVVALIAVLLSTAGCSKTKSYSELLNEEERAVNWYIAKFDVETRIPEDSVFITGKNAPFYKMDREGNVYMRVINAGDPKLKVKEGDRVFFSYMGMSIKDYKDTGTETWTGNAENPQLGSSSFYYKNTVLTSSTRYGTGIQVPMQYLGLNSEVEIVIKSLVGFTMYMNTCDPYVYKVRYFPAEY